MSRLDVAEDVLDVHHPDDLIDGVVVHGNPRVPLGKDHTQDAVHRRRIRHAHHVDPGGHDFAHDGVAELEDGVDHLTLIFLNNPLVLPHLEEEADLLLSHQGGGGVDAAAEGSHHEGADQ